MNELIDRFLNGQTTPEEEHLIAGGLEREYDVDAWLLEDETEAYERIVSLRRRRMLGRWAAVAVLAATVVMGAILLWPQDAAETPVAKTHKVNSDARLVSDNTVMQNYTQTAGKSPRPVRVAKSTPPAQEKCAQPKAADSLQIYIARLEKELDNVGDSDYTTQAEQIIKADERLQRLVQRIMIGEINRGEQSAETADTKEKEEEAL